MAGFIVKLLQSPQSNCESVKKIGQFNLEITKNNSQIFELDNQEIIILDGYFWGGDQDELIRIITEKNFAKLDLFEGHFSGLYITENEIIAFNDRFGAKTVFWQKQNKVTVFTSRANLMPINSEELELSAVHECFNFRWTSGDKTLLKDTNKLRARSYGIFNHNHISQQGYWALSEPRYNQQPFIDKVDLTREALKQNLIKAKTKYKKVAIFLSGGVDSSLLAGLSKDIFNECYLITPVFKGQENPELNTAKAFAKQLNLPHHLVEVCPETLESDLESLINLKREPLRHYSSLAMLAMLKAIPEEFEAVIYGEAADTLFGSNGLNRVNKQYKWKNASRYIPLQLLKMFKSLVPGRGKVLVDLKATSLSQLIYSLTAIQYTPKSRSLIKKFDLGRDSQLEEKFWQENLEHNMATNLRHVVQQYIISSDVEKHFEEAELIAEQYGKHIISPFFDPEVISIANTLNDQDYFGTEYVKPVLREIACDYFDRELIYQRKYGFPVPFVSWLNGTLKYLVDDIRNERVLFDGSELSELSVEDDYEIFWLLINWKIVNQQIHKQKKDKG